MLLNTLTESISTRRFFKDYQWSEIPNEHITYNRETRTLSWQSCEDTSLYKVSIHPARLSRNPSDSSETIHYTHLTSIEIDMPSDGSTYKVRHNELLVAIEANVSTEILGGETGTIDLRKNSAPSEIGEITEVLVHQVLPVEPSSTSDNLSIANEDSLLKVQAGDNTESGSYYFKCIVQYKTEKSLWTVPCALTLEVNVC